MQGAADDRLAEADRLDPDVPEAGRDHRATDQSPVDEAPLTPSTEAPADTTTHGSHVADEHGVTDRPAVDPDPFETPGEHRTPPPRS